MYFFGRGVSAFFNQLFRWLFWNKTGQKLLFSILIVVIFFVFIKCGEVAAVETTEDVNYKVYNYYDNIIADFIYRLDRALSQENTYANDIITSINNGEAIYLCYGSANGGSYNNAYPVSRGYLCVITGNNSNIIATATATSSDYMSVVGFTQYATNQAHNGYRFTSNGTLEMMGNFPTGNQTIYFPLQLFNRKSQLFTEYINAYNNGDTETIIELLSSIEDSLTNTEPTSETDSFVDVDSSSVDDLSSASVDNVFSNMTTNFANKFTNYDLDTVYSFVWNLNGTRITFYSDTLYKMIKGTFFETLLSMLWYYIFGHYAFVWLSNIIHKIKDGSILDGLEVNEVITKEML